MSFADIVQVMPPATWYELPNTKLESVYAITDTGDPRWGVQGPSAVVKDFCGGAFDTTNNIFILHGGGHNSYGGNEVYEFSLDTLSWVAATTPSTYIQDPNNPSNPDYVVTTDGTPVSVHTYDGMQHIPGTTKIFKYGGAMWKSGNAGDSYAYLYDTSTHTWERKAAAPINTLTPATAYDASRHCIWVVERNNILRYNITPDTWDLVKSGLSSRNENVAEYDPVNDRLLIIGGDTTPNVYYYDCVTGNLVTPSVTGETLPVFRVGLVYDTTRSVFVVWNNFRNIYALDPNTFVVTQIDAKTGANPTPMTGLNGMFSKFQYVPDYDVFIGYENPAGNVWVYKGGEAGSGPAPGWGDPQRSVALTIPSTQVIGTHSGFQAVLTRANLPNEMCDPSGANAAQVNGGDIRITLDPYGLSRLPLEIVKFTHDSASNAADAAVLLWTKLPNVSEEQDTTIHVWYHSATTQVQPLANETFGRNEVWASTHITALHINNSGGTTDSSGQSGNLSFTSAITRSDGPFYTGSGSVDVNFNSTAITSILALDQDYTVTFAVSRPGALSGARDYLKTRGTSEATAISLRTVTGSTIKTDILDDTGATQNLVASDSIPALPTWAWITIASSVGTGTQSYYDGSSLINSATLTRRAGDGSISLYHGANHIYWAELLVAKGVSTGPRVATEFANRSSPSTFFTTGTPTGVPALAQLEGASSTVAVGEITPAGVSGAISVELLGNVATGHAGVPEAGTLPTQVDLPAASTVGEVGALTVIVPIVPFAKDDFTDVDGTLLDAHTPTWQGGAGVGGWTLVDATNQPIAVSSNHAQAWVSSDVCIAHNTAAPPSADYQMEGNFTVSSQTLGMKGGFLGRVDGTNGCELTLDTHIEGGNAVLRLIDFATAAESTYIVDTMAGAFAHGPYVVRLECEGSELRGYLDGVLRVSLSGAQVGSLTAGQVGLTFLGYLYVDDFTASELPPAVPATATLVGTSSTGGVGTLTATAASAAFPNGWQRFVEMTVNSGAVAGAGTFTGFPVLITRANLPDEMCDPTSPFAAQANGEDIRATADNVSFLQLPIEVVAFEHDSASGVKDANVEIWVKRDVTSSAPIYLLYNASTLQSKPAATDTYGRNAVWSEYIGAWHMESPTVSVDSSGGGNDLTFTAGVTETTSPYGAAVVLTASDTGTTPVLSTDQDYTIYAVARHHGSMTVNNQLLATRGGGADSAGIKFQATGANEVGAAAVTNSGTFSSTIRGAIGGWPDNTWTVIAFTSTRGNGTQQIYQDGTGYGSTTAVRGTGDRSLAINAANATTMDFAQVFIRKGLSTANRITTEFNNVSSPSTFLATGTPESLEVATTIATPAAASSTASVGALAGITAAVAALSGEAATTALGNATANAGATTALPSTSSVSGVGVTAAVTGALTTPSGLTATAGVGSAAVNVATDTFPSGWNRRVALTIPEEQVSGAITLTDFPVLITRSNLPDEVCDPANSNAAQADGGDLRVSADLAGTTRLPLEVVYFGHDTTTGQGDANVELWVKRDVSATTATVIYLWYNAATTESQPEITDTYGRNVVWSNDYAAVYHMGQANIVDSTANGNDGSVTSGTPIDATGKIGGAQTFSGNYVDVPSDPTLDITSALTLSYWIRHHDVTGARYAIMKAPPGGTSPYAYYGGYYDGASQRERFRIVVEGSAREANSTTAPVAETWYKVHGTYDGTAARIYVNGVLEGTTSASGLIGTVDNALRIGAFGGSGGGPLSGDLDEIRIESVARSPEWIATEFNNQNTPTTFLITDTPESPGTAGVSATLASTHAVTGVGTIEVVAATSASTTLPSIATTATANTPTINTGALATPIQASALTQLGTLSLSVAGGVSVALEGLSVTAHVNTFSIASGAALSIPGNEALVQLGTPQALAGARTALTGAQTLPQSGEIGAHSGAVSVLAPVQGQGTLGTVASVTGARIELQGCTTSATTNTITVATSDGISFALIGVEALAAFGEIAPTSGSVSTLSGLLVESGLGTINIPAAGDVRVTLDGIDASGELGTVIIHAGTVLTISAVQTSGSAGTVLTITNSSGYLVGTISILPALSGTIRLS